jgi:rhodanese-related sulfurtransferase
VAHGPAFIALVDDAKSRIRQFTIEEYLERVKAGEHWILVDIREDHEWQRERMPGAIHIGRGILERDVESQFAKDSPLLLQCGGGFRSALSADALQQMGYTNVVSLDGGIRRWKALGHPTENK